jgi:Tfp pilus assembly pilus retraction ATPase PilT
MQQVHNYLHTGGKNGMQTLEQDLARLVEEGVVTADEAMKIANDKQQLSRFIASQAKPRQPVALGAVAAG